MATHNGLWPNDRAYKPEARLPPQRRRRTDLRQGWQDYGPLEEDYRRVVAKRGTGELQHLDSPD
jgi:hypothetical protein